MEALVEPKIDCLLSSIPNRSKPRRSFPAVGEITIHSVQKETCLVFSFHTSHIPRTYFTVNTNNTPKASILFRSLAPFSIQIRVKSNHPPLCSHAVSISVFQFSILISSSFRSRVWHDE